jgi:hypothetical protein
MKLNNISHIVGKSAELSSKIECTGRKSEEVGRVILDEANFPQKNTLFVDQNDIHRRKWDEKSHPARATLL